MNIDFLQSVACIYAMGMCGLNFDWIWCVCVCIDIVISFRLLKRTGAWDDDDEYDTQTRLLTSGKVWKLNHVRMFWNYSISVIPANPHTHNILSNVFKSNYTFECCLPNLIDSTDFAACAHMCLSDTAEEGDGFVWMSGWHVRTLRENLHDCTRAVLI